MSSPGIYNSSRAYIDHCRAPTRFKQLHNLRYCTTKMTSCNLQKPRGLVLSPLTSTRPPTIDVLTISDREHIRRTYGDVEWIFLDSHPEDSNIAGQIDFVKLAATCRQLIEEYDITVVLGGTNDDSVLLHAYLHEAYPDRIKGPSIKSVVMANIKLLTREHLVPKEANLKYCSIDLEKPDIQGAIDIVGLPLILKPLFGSYSTMIRVCHNVLDVAKALEDLCSDVSLSMTTYKQRFGSLITDDLYNEFPYLSCRIAVAEEFVSRCDAISTHYLQMFVQNGIVQNWGVNDDIYWEKRPQVFLGCGFPSLLPNEYQKKGRIIGLDMAKEMIKQGFNNQFQLIEFWVMNNGSIKVMEINPRVCFHSKPIHSKLLDRGDCLQTIIDAQLNRIIGEPTLKSEVDMDAPRYGILGFINVITAGMAGDIYNYELASTEAVASGESWWLTSTIPESARIHESSMGESGCDFGFALVTGENFRGCKEKLKQQRVKLLKGKYQLDCWDPEFDWEVYLLQKLRDNQLL